MTFLKGGTWKLHIHYSRSTHCSFIGRVKPCPFSSILHTFCDLTESVPKKKLPGNLGLRICLMRRRAESLTQLKALLSS